MHGIAQHVLRILKPKTSLNLAARDETVDDPEARSPGRHNRVALDFDGVDGRPGPVLVVNNEVGDVGERESAC